MVPAKRASSPSPGREGSRAKNCKLGASASVNETLVLKPTNVVRLEIYQLNGIPFERSLTKKEIKDIWLGLGRKPEEVKQVRSLVVEGKGCKLNFTLHSHIKIDEIGRYPELTVATKNDDLLTEVYKIWLINYDTLASNIGQMVTVTLSTPDDVSPDDIKDWLQCFGELKSDLRTFTDENGILTEDFEIDILLREHIIEILPIKGRRVRIFYRGIPKLCNNCYGQGHIKRDCTNPKVDWTKYVSDLYSSGLFEEEMFGSWMKVLRERAELELKDTSINGWTEQTWDSKAPARGRGKGKPATPHQPPQAAHASFLPTHFHGRGRGQDRGHRGLHSGRGCQRHLHRQNIGPF